MIIVANWKAYVEDLEKATKLFAVSKRLAKSGTVTIVLAPPAPLLGALAHKSKSPVAFAAQDLSVTTGGAATGESTAQAFEAAGVSYAIVGHSERRALGETDAMIKEKITHALAHNLTPILCVGERERDGEGRYLSHIREELTRALEGLAPREFKNVIIAYEPLWAIGKSAENAIDSSDLAEMVLYIRKVLTELAGKAPQTRILYGGSVESSNVRELASLSSVDGFLVGHASTDPTEFALLVQTLS